MGAYFLPQIGTAPKWIQYLDNITEEVEERKTDNGYEDFKFVTKNDLEQLNATHLIGTNTLKSYMHGYFMDLRTYNKLLAVADPFAFEKYRERRIKEKMDKMAEDRIMVSRKMPKVNTNFDLAVMKEDRKLSKKKKRQAKEEAKARQDVLADSRFGKMFTDKNFEREER